ncbi:MAG TPA: YaiO family outer membrane beta-barrel protein [Allosphingosinicella sp.]
MKLVAAALALVLCPASAAAQPVGRAYDQAVQARIAGDHARAAELLGPVVASDPGNADAQLQLGLALLGLGRLDEAEAAFRRTLAIAPNYADARLGLARVQQRRGNWAAAQAELALVDAGHPEAAPMRRQIEAGAAAARFNRWQIDLDGGYAFLTQDQPDWKEGALRVTHRTSVATALGAGLEVSRRFGLTDTYGELRFEQRFSNNSGSAYFFAGGTPNADFRPEWQIGLGGELRIRPGGSATLLTLDARQARYDIGDIQTLNPGVDQYLANGRAWIGARWINIFDEGGRHHSGWLLRGDTLATERLRLFAGAADAPDTSEGVVVGVFSLFGGFAYDVNESVTVRASIAHEDRDTGSDRLQLGLGAGWKF